MTDMTTNSTVGATSATTEKPAAANTARPPQPQAPRPQAPQAPKLTFVREKFQGVKLAKLRLLTPDTIQYDQDNPELVLDTAKETGKILPLTPFFQSRLGKTIELLELID